MDTEVRTRGIKMGKIGKKWGTIREITQKEGMAVLVYKTEKKLQSLQKKYRPNGEYLYWIKKNEADIMKVEPLKYQPLISVIVPVYNVKQDQLEACIRSVQQQTYGNWELCMADDASTWSSVRECLQKYETDDRIHIIYREKNGHISKCTNTALEMAQGEFVAFMDCDDVLAPNALYEVARKLNEDSSLDFIYSDEDKINEKGKKRHQPHFKPDWSPDTFMSLMYTCHLGVYRRKLGEKIGWLREGYEGAQDYDFTLRFTEQTNKIGHIPKILYHWRERSESTAVNPDAKSYIFETAKKAKEDALKRRGIKGTVEWIPDIYQYRVNYDVPEGERVSVIIPSKDHFDICKRCVDSLKQYTKKPSYEIIVVDNGSSPEQKKQYQRYCDQNGYTYHYEPMEFNFSRMCNIGAREAKGRFLLFLNDDISICNDIWMERMAGHAALPHVGAVGAKLLYPDTTLIQHIGVISFTGGPVHSFCQMDDTPVRYFCRNRIEYNYSAVTAACLMIDQEKFRQVGGFDESFAVAYNDVDFCFKLTEHGYYNVSRMDAVLYHHESLSRGSDVADMDKMQRLLREREHLYRDHPQYISKDPFYSPNLTMQSADCAINLDFRNRELVPVEPEDVSENRFAEYAEKDSVKRGIRYLEMGSDYLIVDGWCFDEEKKWNNIRKNRILLESRMQSYVCDSVKGYSEAMQIYADKQGYYGMCTFRVKINTEKVQPGDYEIYVVRSGRKIKTGKAITIRAKA